MHVCLEQIQFYIKIERDCTIEFIEDHRINQNKHSCLLNVRELPDSQFRFGFRRSISNEKTEPTTNKEEEMLLQTFPSEDAAKFVPKRRLNFCAFSSFANWRPKSSLSDERSDVGWVKLKF